MSEDNDVCPRCQNRGWVFSGDHVIECECTEDTDESDNLRKDEK